ncbi:SagB family peptide dehydrogenase [Streptomyces rameus]
MPQAGALRTGVSQPGVSAVGTSQRGASWTGAPAPGAPGAGTPRAGALQDGGGTGPAAWYCLAVSGGDPEELLVGLVRPWAEDALVAGAITGWAVDRTPHGLVIAVLGDGEKPVTDLSEHLTAAVSTAPGGQVTRTDWPVADAWPEAHLTAATALAVEVIAATRSRPKRLRAAADLLLAAADTAGADPLARLRWLRAHARRQGTPAETDRGRRGAETDFHRDQAEWLRHHHRVAGELRAPGGRLATWRDTLARVGRTGTDTLHRAAELTGRQLGLSAEERAYTAWIASLAALPGPREPYFADGPDAVDRRYHEDSKYIGVRLQDQRPDLVQAETGGRHPLGPVLETVPLPEPQAPPAGPALPEVLLARRSGYGSYRGPLTLAELSTLLHHSAAVTAVKQMSPELSYRVRPYPSGGTRYPLQLVLYCHDVTGLPRGTYRYEPDGHALELLGTEDISAELQRCAPATDPDVLTPPKAGGNVDASRCPLWILTVGDLTYQRLHYGLRSYRLVLQETGHLAQNLALTATWLGKSSVGLSGYYDDAVNQLVGVDGIGSAVLYLHVIGVTGQD